MADLSSASHTNVNDVESAQGSPVSEALAQKLGSNSNNLNARLTTAETNISTNSSGITQNAADIANKLEIETANQSITGVSTTFGTIKTFANNVSALLLYVKYSGAEHTIVVFPGIETTLGTLTFRISSNVNLDAKVSSGSANFDIKAVSLHL